MTAGQRGHGKTQVRKGSQLLAFVNADDLGDVSTEDGILLKWNPDTVLAPDVAFISKIRLEAESRTWSDTPPDMAVEVASPSNARDELERKVRKDNRVHAVWLVFSERSEVEIHSPAQPMRIVSGDKQLEGGEVCQAMKCP